MNCSNEILSFASENYRRKIPKWTKQSCLKRERFFDIELLRIISANDEERTQKSKSNERCLGLFMLHNL